MFHNGPLEKYEKYLPRCLNNLSRGGSGLVPARVCCELEPWASPAVVSHGGRQPLCLLHVIASTLEILYLIARQLAGWDLMVSFVN